MEHTANSLTQKLELKNMEIHMTNKTAESGQAAQAGLLKQNTMMISQTKDHYEKLQVKLENENLKLKERC
jgi:hypothetical protein